MKLPSEYFAESQSDKTDNYHHYGDIYDVFITSLLYLNENKPLNVLEIGASRFGEGSGHAFCKMPYVEKFVGIDPKPLKVPFEDSGIFLRGNAYCDGMLKEVENYAPFHLMIDDGTHNPKDWHFFIRNYSRLLEEPGAMVVEDVHTPHALAQYRFFACQHSFASKGGRLACLLKL